MPKLSFQYVRQQAPESLVEFLARRFRYHTLERWLELVGQGRVKVNGRRVSPNLVLETRHKIVYESPPGPEPAVDGSFRVLFEDGDVLAVEKSANIPTSPSGKYWHNCLVHVLQKELGLPGLRAVHRLDRETSGINLFAKNRPAAGKLGKDFARGAVQKTYAAVLVGRVPVREFYVSAPLLDDPHGEVRVKQVVHPLGRASATRFQLLAILPGASLVQVVPVTGRTHQIRVHAAFAGHPVVGDKLYGQEPETFLEWVAAGNPGASGRHLLHATGLSLAHPVSGQPLQIRASPKALVAHYLAGAPSQPVTPA